MKYHPLNSVKGALDNYSIGDKLNIDLGDTLLEGFYRGLLRKQIGEEIRYYIQLKVIGKRELELVSTRDYPDLRIAEVLA